MSGHLLSVQNAEKEEIWAFFNVLGGQISFYLKRTNLPKRGRMVTLYITKGALLCVTTRRVGKSSTFCLGL